MRGFILGGCGVADIGINLRPAHRGGLPVQPWRRLCIWQTTLNVRVGACLLRRIVILRVSSQQHVRQCPSHLRQHLVVVSTVEFAQVMQELRAVHHSRIPHHHTRLEDPIGQKPRCLSSLHKSVLSGMADITVINPLSLSSCMAPPHGNWCWQGA